jgi:hypothetical protein
MKDASRHYPYYKIPIAGMGCHGHHEFFKAWKFTLNLPASNPKDQSIDGAKHV